MADVTLLNVDYPDVPRVDLPKTGGGVASFTDVTDTTATAENVESGKYFYTSSGLRAVGTLVNHEIAKGSTTGNIKASGTTTKQVQFGTTFSSTPTVLLTFGGSPGDNSGAANLFGNLQLYVSSVSSTDFTFKLVNSSTSSAASSTTVHWVAIL